MKQAQTGFFLINKKERVSFSFSNLTQTTEEVYAIGETELMNALQ